MPGLENTWTGKAGTFLIWGIKKMTQKTAEGHVLMPKSLTAENGAKAALMGEFYEIIQMDCPECKGDGCDECGGVGSFEQPVNISWSTIKEIYASAVEFFNPKGGD